MKHLIELVLGNSTEKLCLHLILKLKKLQQKRLPRDFPNFNVLQLSVIPNSISRKLTMEDIGRACKPRFEQHSILAH